MTSMVKHLQHQTKVQQKVVETKSLINALNITAAENKMTEHEKTAINPNRGEYCRNAQKGRIKSKRMLKEICA